MPLVRVTANGHTEEIEALSITHAACLYIGIVIGNRPPAIPKPGPGTVLQVESNGQIHEITFERAMRWD